MLGKEPTISIVIGILLIIIGIVGRFGTGTTSVTALIPAFFGLPIAILGIVARDPRRLKVSMHIVAVLALLGVLGTYSVIGDLIALVAGNNPDGVNAAFLSRGSMFVLCLALLIVSIVSFVQVRRNRRKTEAA